MRALHRRQINGRRQQPVVGRSGIGTVPANVAQIVGPHVVAGKSRTGITAFALGLTTLPIVLGADGSVGPTLVRRALKVVEVVSHDRPHAEGQIRGHTAGEADRTKVVTGRDIVLHRAAADSGDVCRVFIGIGGRGHGNHRVVLTAIQAVEQTNVRNRASERRRRRLRHHRIGARREGIGERCMFDANPRTRVREDRHRYRSRTSPPMVDRDSTPRRRRLLRRDRAKCRTPQFSVAVRGRRCRPPRTLRCNNWRGRCPPQ